MKKIIWRSRVITILGFLVVLLAFDGPPEYLEKILTVIFGVAIMILGFSGNKYANQISQAYTIPDEDDQPSQVATPEASFQTEQVRESLEEGVVDDELVADEK